MRISDWSSDVCSSDLLPGRPRAPVADFQARALGIGQDADQRVDVAMIVGGIERARNVALQSLRQRDTPREQIGSASGRVRVGQYVLITWVAVSLKKKQQQSTYYITLISIIILT